MRSLLDRRIAHDRRIAEYLATHNFLAEVDEDPSPCSRGFSLVIWAIIIVGSICIFGGLIFIGLLTEWPQ